MKKKRAYAVAALGIMICAAVGTGFYFYHDQESNPESPVMPEGMSLPESAVSAAGLTSVGILEETCELGFLEDGLYVEETYLNMGDEVEAGTAVFKVSEESLEHARRELEKKVQETALNRRQGAITYDTGLVEAQKEKELAAVEADYAQSVYENAVAAAQEEVDALQKEADEAQEKVNEYTASIEEDYYYTYYEVAEKEATWKEHAAFLMELYRDWNVETLEDLYGRSGGKNGTGYVTNQVTASGAFASGNLSGQNEGGEMTESSSGTSSALEGGNGPAGSAPGVSFSLETVSGVYFTQENAAGENEDRKESVTEGVSREGSGSGAGADSTGEGSEDDNGGLGTDGEGNQEAGEGSGTGNDTGTGNGSGGDSGTGTEDNAGTDDDSGSGGGSKPEEGQSGDNGGKRPSGSGADALGSGGLGGGSVSGNNIQMGSSVNVSDDEIRYNIYLAMEEETKESKQAYETALENYENAKRKAEAGISEAQSELTVLLAQLEEQKTAYEKTVIAEKLTFDMAISDNENAQMVYESTVKQLEEEYETLKEEEENAAENLELFVQTIGDGIFYTDSAGTVMMTTVRAAQWITEDTVVIAYSNPDTVTIAASVDQTDIASVEIGQEAFALISGYGSYTGKVTSIDPVSASNGSSVAYTVNVRLEGDVSALEANLTAYVYLGLTEEEKEMMSQSVVGRNGQRGESGGQQDTEGSEKKMPEKEMPDSDGENGMPDGAAEDNMPGNGSESGGFPEGGEMPYGAADGMPDGVSGGGDRTEHAGEAPGGRKSGAAGGAQ